MADTETPIKDENLRLVLSKDHERYLKARFDERITWSAWIALVCIPLACIDLYLIFALETHTPLSFLVLITVPFASMVVGRNLWCLNEQWKHYRGHIEFLKKYGRTTEMSVEKLDKAWRRSKYSISLVIAGMLAVPMASLQANWHFQDIKDEMIKRETSDYLLCRNLPFSQPDWLEEAARRGLNETSCKKILAHSPD